MTKDLSDVAPATEYDIEPFIARWSAAGGTERANYQLFLTELCAVLGLPQPDPAGDDTEENAYVFERRVDIDKPDGTSTRGFIDLYKRGCFVLEAKQTGKVIDTDGWDKAMLKAQNQADQYVRALPTGEGRPPFIVVTDVGRSLELYAEFSRSGGTYVPFPDPGHHRIRLEDLRLTAVQSRLRALWTAPESLDPSKHAARVTRAVSSRLAELARSLEQQGYEVQRVAHFLKRCLFTMFSEDVGLLPEGSFTRLLETQRKHPEHFADALRALWESMNTGGYSPILNTKVRQFNGGLFQGVDPIPLNPHQIGMLWEAAKADWRYVEPAIFGTLLERALDPRERHKLGAHYTPRAYVERLVMPTLIDPLRGQWRTTQVAAETWLQQGRTDKALAELRDYHHRLCQIRVLDPACGSGNFLYVALEHMKRLEGEVLNLIRDLSAGQASFETEGLTVDPHQFLGLELNPRAAAIAEIVLWIGYLQWHHRIHGKLDIPDPVLRDFQNIQHRDALLEYNDRELILNKIGQPATIWDGISYKLSPTTDELIPDETGRLAVYRYIEPRKATWPDADYIIGNPPFIGASTMRRALGDGYVAAVRKAYQGEVPDSADLVMYWWHNAALKVRQGEAVQFGFITTNSVRQTFNRKVLESHLDDTKRPISLVFAVPDHPWVDSNDGAAVRIAMTVGVLGEHIGEVRHVVDEFDGFDHERSVVLGVKKGKVNSDLTLGANLAGATGLEANSRLTSRGVMLFGRGFIVSPERATALGFGSSPEVESRIKEYRNGKDLTQTPRGAFVIDLYGLTAEEVRQRVPTIYQWILDRVKPERDQNRDERIRQAWWLHGRPRPEWRHYSRNLSRYIATVETMKHRVFQFLDAGVLPDNKLINFALDDALYLGILSSRLHVAWAMAAGSWLGVGNDSVYVKTRCFETFPLPVASASHETTIRQLAESLDSHRKAQQALHPRLRLTAMYNVLEKLRSGEALTAKEKITHQQGLVSVLRELHDELDRAVFEAYGWGDLADALVGKPGATTPLPDKPAEQAEAEEVLLTRLVELNAQRAAEEAQGHVRWLRPEYQAPDTAQLGADLAATESAEAVATGASQPAAGKQAWPKSLRDQIEAVRGQLALAPQATDTLAAVYKRKPAKSVAQVLSALEGLGHIESRDGVWYLN